MLFRRRHPLDRWPLAGHCPARLATTHDESPNEEAPMADRKNNSRVLRQLAEGLFDGLAAQGIALEAERDDFVTSLVRQWITNDGIATWFVGEEQLYFTHRHTPLGKPLLSTERVQPGWFAELQRDWHIDPEEFPDIIEQLNRGQSAETTNTEGVPLRLWV